MTNIVDIIKEQLKMMRRGYDGIIIKGREIVNFKPPSDVMYFSNERQLVNYYESAVGFGEIK